MSCATLDVLAGTRALTPRPLTPPTRTHVHRRAFGFPDGYTSITPPLSTEKRWKMLGNSFSVPCVAFLLRELTLGELLTREQRQRIAENKKAGQAKRQQAKRQQAKRHRP